MPRLPLLTAKNKDKNEINVISHWVCDLVMLTDGSIFLGLSAQDKTNIRNGRQH